MNTSLICPTCGVNLRHKRSLDRHIMEKHTNGRTYSCDRCPYSSDREVNMIRHRANHSNMSSTEEDKLLKKYNHLIRTHAHRTRKIQDKFNINLEEITIEQAMKDIFKEQTTKFKINLAFGFILQHKTTGQLSYYYATKNTQILDKPTFIGNEGDLKKITKRLSDMDPLQYDQMRRPDTRYSVHTVTNALFYVTKIRGHPIGNPGANEFEQYLLKSRSVHALMCDHEARRYTDNLCSFRCLALSSGYKSSDMEREAKRLSKMWTTGPCPGVTMEELDRVEEMYNVRIFVYSLVSNERDFEEVISEPLEEEEDHPSAQLKRRPVRKAGRTIYLNMNNNHFPLITKLPSFIKSWKCSKCGKLFKRHSHLIDHECVCDEIVQYIYPGGGYRLPMNVFETLMDEGLMIEDRLYPYRAAYDFEARFTPVEQGSEKLQYVNELTPVSFSIATDIPGTSTISGRPYTEAYCQIREAEELADKFYSYLLDASAASYNLMRKKYSDICDRINAKQEDMKNLKGLIARMKEEDAPAEEIIKIKVALREARKWEFIKSRFNTWLCQLPVIGFNSGKFDMNLIRRYLVPHFTQNGIEAHVIKKTGAYMAISTNDALFLDVTNYLAAGTSYDKWLKAFEIKEAKGHFPYEWLTSIDKLDQDHLPSYAEFYSTLKQTNIAPEEYNQAQETWGTEGFRTMRDYLIWYNNRDVRPFLEALERMISFWRTLEIDMLKDGDISLPGLAFRHMFKTTDKSTIFPIFSDKTWHNKIRDNIVGGPSIIFNRHKEVGTSTIRGGKPVENIVGYDANSLYLWCIGQDMPTGHYGIWEPITEDRKIEVPTHPANQSQKDIGINIHQNLNPEFKRTRGLQSTFGEYVWCEWMRQCLSQETGKSLTLRHHVYGNQKSFNIDGSSLPVDGYIPELGIILQYQGCYFHGHDCLKNKNQELMQKRQAKTERSRLKLQSTGLKLIETYECKFNAEKKSNQALKAFYDTNCLPYPSRLNGHQLIQAIKRGLFFGVIECDLQVPWWIPGMRERFSEMTPIFKNTEISLEDISPHMQAFAESRGLMNQPRKCLIGSYHATGIVLTTPLVKWYLDQGLVITSVHSAVQYNPKPAFKHLMDEVANHRRATDMDPSKKILGELFKLIGNSYYGKCITDQKKHVDVKFVNEKEAGQYVNDKMFRKLEEVDDQTYEISMAKKRITFNLPIMVAFFVYGYAKLRMLDFYYEFIEKFVDRSDYECMSMDTDSLYMAISGPNIASIVKPHMQSEYTTEMPSYLATMSYSNRTPGLFKLEYEGIGMIALNSKAYSIWTKDSGEKLSCKGISKRTNNLKPEQFQSVLDTKESIAGTNYGFRMIDGKILQYQQARDGLVYLYIKRRVLEDGVTTAPLYI